MAEKDIVDEVIEEGRQAAANESSADILAEMRGSGKVGEFWAIRLEAALKREAADPDWEKEVRND